MFPVGRLHPVVRQGWRGLLKFGWFVVDGVRCLWRHSLTSFPCFQTNVLAKFVDMMYIFFYIHSPYLMSHCTEYKLSVLQIRLSEKNKLNATTQQFITAKISGCALKQGSEAHSSLRPSNLQLQNEAALMSCRIRAVEHRKCATGPPVYKIESCKTTQELRMRMKKATQENFNFLLCI